VKHYNDCPSGENEYKEKVMTCVVSVFIIFLDKNITQKANQKYLRAQSSKKTS
jgi:hypothetical protein